MKVKVLSVVDVHICDYVKARATFNSSNIVTFAVRAFQMHLFDENRLNFQLHRFCFYVQVNYGSGHEPCRVFCPVNLLFPGRPVSLVGQKTRLD